MLFVCLFDLIIYVPVNTLSVMSGRVFLVLKQYKARINVSLSNLDWTNTYWTKNK